MFKKSFLSSSATLVCLLFFSVQIISCSKKDNPAPAANTTTTDPTPSFASQVIGKWTVGDGSAKIEANTSGYSKFEFTKGKSYIITKSDGTYLTGFYTEDTTNKTITLGTFGKITVTKLEGTILNFTLRLTGTTTDITIFSNKSGDLVSSTSRTDSLCQAWVLVTMYDNGVENTTVRDGVIAGTLKGTVIISSYGTFLTIQEVSGNPPTYNNGAWSWNDANQTSFCKGLAPNCTGADQAKFIDGKFHHIFVNSGPVAHTMEEVYQKAN